MISKVKGYGKDFNISEDSMYEIGKLIWRMPLKKLFQIIYIRDRLQISLLIFSKVKQIN